MKLIQIQNKDLRAWRRQQWIKQKRKCAVTGLPLSFKDSVVDHCHKTKVEIAGVNGKGLIRGVIHKNINQLEGKISNVYQRYGLKNIASLPEILRGLANYLENPPVNDCLHPSCVSKIKRKKLSKSDIKRVYKYWKQMYGKRKLPKPTNSVTKQWANYIRDSRELAGLKRRKE